MITPRPFITFRRKVGLIALVQLTTFIGQAVELFALNRLYLRDFTMFPSSLKEQILEPEE